MILALSSKASRDLANEFQKREVKKEYVARVRGCFPEYVLKSLLLLDSLVFGLVSRH